MTTPYSKVLSQELLDCGKRAHDEIMLHLSANEWFDIKNKYVAIRLVDGGSDHQLYDTRVEAIKHQHFEQECYYVNFVSLAGGSNPTELAVVIKMARDMYAQGLHYIDPDDLKGNGGPTLIPTTAFTDSYSGKVRQRAAFDPKIFRKGGINR